jgi:2-oxoglutarate ferredoxin oxidoreductase subunit alpha
MDLPQKYFEKKPKLKVNDLNFKIGGEAGFGIMAAGIAFAKIASRSGLFIHGYVEYPSLVRGGHNTYQIKVSNYPNPPLEKKIDLLVALNKKSIDLEMENLSDQSAIIFDPYDFKLRQEDFKKKVLLLAVPLERFALEKGSGKLMINSVAIGAAISVLGLDFEVFKTVLIDAFFGKSEEIVNSNIEAAKAGYDFAKKYTDGFHFKLEKVESPPSIVVSGNEAMALGTISAGCKFYASYPMTPSSSILHFLAAKQVDADMVVKHAADEIEAVNMAIGASFSGVRAQVGTSGGGFALMAEAYGLAGMTETPLVLIDVQRPGPATGLPTWTGQADLDFVLSAGQDEFPRIVIAPGDVKEAFGEIVNAHNLAQKYQTTVMVLSDKYLGESVWSEEFFDDDVKIETGNIYDGESDFKRYEILESGVSTRSLPGQTGGKFIANSYEHDEFGFTTESADIRQQMMNKRMRKLETLAQNLPQPILYGKDETQVTLVSWGSTKLACLSAIEILAKEGISANFLHIVYVNPFPKEKVEEVLRQAKETLICEGNYSGQMANLIRAKTGIEIPNKFLKFDGRPIYPEEIVEAVRKVI